MSGEISDPAAERGVLAGLFQHGGDAYLDVADFVTTHTFTVPANQVLWACAQSVLEKDGAVKSLDYPSILSSAHSLGLSHHFDKEDEVAHLRAVMNMPTALPTVRRLGGQIRKLEIARLFHEQLGEVRWKLERVSGMEPIDEIVQMVEGPIFDLSSLLTSTQSEGPRLMGAGAEEYVQYLMENPREMVGISTGFSRLDKALGGGLRKNSLDVIAARMKQGKTFLVDNIALHIAGKTVIPVLNLDTEMTWEEHLHRILANLSGYPIEEIETGKVGLNDIPRSKVKEAAKRLADMPYHYNCIIGQPFEDILASIRRWVTRTVGLDENGHAKDCVIIYDYLKVMGQSALSKNVAEYQALGFITTALKNFMGRYRVPCLSFAQLNRDGIDKEDTDVISGSDRILMYGTSFTIYKKKTEEERAESGPKGRKYTHKLKPIFARSGAGLEDAEDYINIEANYKCGRITEGPTRFELEGNTECPGGHNGGEILQGDPDDCISLAG